jgi:hypothetical protein
VIESDLLKASGYWDYGFLQFDGSSLIVGGGSPFMYRANPAVTLKFVDVSYINCPTEFHYAEFSLAPSSLIEDLRGSIGIEDTDVVVAITVESARSLHRQSFVIVAERVEVVLRPS